MKIEFKSCGLLNTKKLYIVLPSEKLTIYLWRWIDGSISVRGDNKKIVYRKKKWQSMSIQLCFHKTGLSFSKLINSVKRCGTMILSMD